MASSLKEVIDVSMWHCGSHARCPFLVLHYFVYQIRVGNIFHSINYGLECLVLSALAQKKEGEKESTVIIKGGGLVRIYTTPFIFYAKLTPTSL